jgi:hypothetical protein
MFTILLANIFQSFGYSQTNTFEGEIVFVRETLTDTSYFSYKIKGDRVRIDELDNEMRTKNYMIVNLDKPKIYAVNPTRKLYTSLPIQPWNHDNDPQSDYQVIKTDNYKYLNGYKCNQWRVRNKAENTEIAYWVADNQFVFFQKLLKLLNRSEKSSEFYLRIPETEGFFPMLAVERSMLREKKSKLEVININQKSMDEALFEIPKDFKVFQKS